MCPAAGVNQKTPVRPPGTKQCAAQDYRKEGAPRQLQVLGVGGQVSRPPSTLRLLSPQLLEESRIHPVHIGIPTALGFFLNSRASYRQGIFWNGTLRNSLDILQSILRL